jgi:alginate O-acetyltransferase complex protein AlgJ
VTVIDPTQEEQPRRSLPPVHESLLPNEHPLHRPRHGTTQRTALVCAVVFFCTPLLLLLVGVRAPSFENRPLAAFPSPADGWGFLTGMAPWAADHLPLRDQAVGLEDFLSRQLFGEPPPLGQQSRPDPVPGPVAPAPSQSDEDRRRMQELGFPRVIEGRDGWLYFGEDVVDACLPERPLDETVTALRRLRSAVESSGREFVLVVAPDKSTMVPEHLPARYVGADCTRDARNAFWPRITSETGAIDMRPRLQQDAARLRRPVYPPVDTHWTYEGALTMTIMIAEAIQPGVTATWVATPGQVVTRAGDLPPLIGRTADYPWQTYNLAPDGETIRSRSVSSEIRTPLNLSQQRGEGIVSDSVGMIADSYSLSALPYIAAGFTNISVIHSDTVGADPRSIGTLFADKKVVVVEAVERSLIGGTHPLFDRGVIDALADELARHPLR